MPESLFSFSHEKKMSDFLPEGFLIGNSGQGTYSQFLLLVHEETTWISVLSIAMWKRRRENTISQKRGFYGLFLLCSNFISFEVVDLSTLSTGLIILILFL